MSDTKSSKWEPPEVAAIAVLVGVSIFIVGGVASGIAFGSGRFSDAAQATVRATQWANLYTAVVLLAVIGTARWIAHRAELERLPAVSLWAEVLLCVASLGAVASFVGTLVTYSGLSYPPQGLVWSSDISSAANLLEALVITVTGLLVGGQLQDRMSQRRA